jgi:hypothetical protein
LVQGAPGALIVLLLLGAGILAMGHRHSAVAPLRANSVPAPEAAAEGEAVAGNHHGTGGH